jgi:type III secretory pathway component EscT
VDVLIEWLGGWANVERWLATGALVAARVAPLTLFAPWLMLAKTPVVIRSGVVVALTFAFAPLCVGRIDAEALEATHGLTFAAWVLREAMVGTLFAVATAVPFYALDWAGRLTDTWRGASLAEVIAPPTGERTSPLGDLYLLMGIAVFVSLGGHRFALAAFAEGLVVAPPGSIDLAARADEIVWGAARLTGSALAFAASIAAPAAVSIVVVEAGLGLVARSVPQVPVFFAGMPLRAAVGLAAALIGLSVVVGELPAAFEVAIDTARDWTQ